MSSIAVPESPLRDTTGRRPRGWVLMAVLAVVVTLVSSRYFATAPELYFEEQRETYEQNIGILLTHIAGASIALLLGPVQFLPRIRGRWPRAHRVLGRAYFGGVVIGSISGLLLARIAFGGITSTLGFGLLASIWLISGAKAISEIRHGRVDSHREWMIRNYALTFAAVTLRLWLPLLTLGFAIDFDLAYPAVSWLCWVPNLAVAELIISNRRQSRRPLITSG